MKTLLSTIVGCSIASLTLITSAQVVSVPGTANPWLAGQPPGPPDGGGDSAPAESPVLAGSVIPGGTVTWTATGLESNGPGYPEVGPDGDLANLSGFGLIDHYFGAENDISDVLNVPIDSLMGVFLGPGGPSGPVPTPLDFSVIGLNYTSLSPTLDQPFYMGDGSTESLMVPAGATSLYLGTMDGFGWNNNPGSFTVDFTEGVTAPDAGSTAAMLGVAFGLIGFARRKTS